MDFDIGLLLLKYYLFYWYKVIKFRYDLEYVGWRFVVRDIREFDN